MDALRASSTMLLKGWPTAAGGRWATEGGSWWWARWSTCAWFWYSWTGVSEGLRRSDEAPGVVAGESEAAEPVPRP